MSARSDAQAAHERISATVLEIDADYCENRYGVSPCTAGITHSGTARAAAPQSLTLAVDAADVDDGYAGLVCVIVSGTGAGQERMVLASRKNLCRNSEALTASTWVGKSSFITATLNNDGVAEKFTVGTWPGGTSQSICGQVVGITSDITFTCSMEVKKGNGKYVQMVVYSRADSGVSRQCRMNFNLDTGTTTLYTNTGSIFAFVTMTLLADGYYRCTLSINKSPGVAYSFRFMQFCNNSGSAFGNTSSMYHWVRRVQVERGIGYAGYIHTEAAAAVGVIVDRPWDVLPDATSVYALVERSTACYNTFSGCKDRPNFSKGLRTYRFSPRGMVCPAGVSLRPYISSSSFSPTEIPVGGGLAPRSQTTLSLVDEVCADDADLYRDTRPTPAGGTYWSRFLARNYNTAGRPARLRKGYVTAPFDWSAFQDELYLMASITGPDTSGAVQVVLTDVIKTLDQRLIPATTDGALLADLKAYSHVGLVAAADSGSVTLDADAPATDGALAGQEVYVYAGTGAGQRRVITTYTGATRVAVLATDWSVIPGTSSSVQVSRLDINVGSNKIAQYPDPAVTGVEQFVCLGKEIIQYTSITGDSLVWADTTARAQFGTQREDHASGEAVQACFAPIGKSVASVVQSICNAGGVSDDWIDLVGLVAEDVDWLSGATISSCLHKPEKASAVLNDLLQAVMMTAWWDVVAQKFRFKVDMPQSATSVKKLTDDNFIYGSLKIAALPALRLSRSFLSFAPYSSTGNMAESTNFSATVGYVDASAEGQNEYDAVVGEQKYFKWFGIGNINFAQAWVARRVSRLRDTPYKISVTLDPRDEVALGDLVDVVTRKKTDASGTPSIVRMRVTKVLDRGNFDLELSSTTFGQRYAVIGPAGLPDYALASDAQRAYAYLSDAYGLMSDGSTSYLIS